jgi:hypothetical protein
VQINIVVKTRAFTKDMRRLMLPRAPCHAHSCCTMSCITVCPRLLPLQRSERHWHARAGDNITFGRWAAHSAS